MYSNETYFVWYLSSLFDRISLFLVHILLLMTLYSYFDLPYLKKNPKLNVVVFKSEIAKGKEVDGDFLSFPIDHQRWRKIMHN